MRPVDKGEAPKVYKKYGDARHDLAKRIGYYCSYCEMKVRNSIEVEHILPQNQGGDVVSWNNFLLSCKYCNTIKSDHNDNLDDYLWPDRDNTDLAFVYSEANAVQVNSTVDTKIRALAENSIRLMGLDRYPGGTYQPTKADTRWISRKEAWDLAKRSLDNWNEAPIIPMAEQIAITALNGHYCIWVKVFREIPEVLEAIDSAYNKYGLFKRFDSEGNRTLRDGGRL